MPSALFQGRDFSDGLAAVRVVSQWFYVDQHGVQVMPKTFFAAGDFSESVAPVKFDNGEAVFINRKGEVMLRGNFVSAQKFSSGLAQCSGKTRVERCLATSSITRAHLYLPRNLRTQVFSPVDLLR